MVDGPIVSVRGEVHLEVPPELARFSVTVVARDKDRQAALTRLTERVETVRRLVDGYGPAIDRRETGQLWVRPELKRSGERVVAYHGSVSTTVTVTDFAVLGELMIRLADQEQTTVAGPWWELRPDSPVHREARRAAIDDAFTRAREYAEALGTEITALLEVSDTGPAGQPMMMTRAAYGESMSVGSGGLPELDLDPQPQNAQASVEARFMISEPAWTTRGRDDGGADPID